MKRAILFLAAIALATPAIAQHVHEDMQAQATAGRRSTTRTGRRRAGRARPGPADAAD